MNKSNVSNDYTAPKPLAGTGCVLAGGKSRRMGSDKALLPFDGRALIEHAFLCLSGFDEVFISARDPYDYAFTEKRIVTDRKAGLGPIEGIAAALAAARHDRVCFRPVDTPLVPPELHEVIFHAIGDFDACIPTFGGRPEPLLGCYTKSMLQILDDLTNSGIHRVSSVFSHSRTIEIPLEDFVSRFGDPDAYLVNANDPETFRVITRAASPLDPAKR